MSDPYNNRYHVVKSGFFTYAVLCGSGDRILFKSRSKNEALNMASELRAAFYDGIFVGQGESA